MDFWANERMRWRARLLWRLVCDITVPIVFLVCLAILPIANYRLEGSVWMPVGAAYLTFRAVAFGSAGVIATYRTHLSLWGSALAAAIAFFAEQLVAGIWFAVQGQLASAMQVIQVFVLLVWIPAFIGVLGGIAGKTLRARAHSRAVAPPP